MARLRAHGTEVMRLEKRTASTEEHVSERRETLSIRSDGSVLRKRSAVWRPDASNPQARLLGGTWKMHVTAAQARARNLTPELWRERLLAMGYTVQPTKN